MAPDPAPARPGSMTVSPWAGWEDVLTGLLLVLLVVAVAAVVVLWSAAARASASGRAEWQAELDERSHSRRAAVEQAPHPGTSARCEGRTTLTRTASSWME